MFFSQTSSHTTFKHPWKLTEPGKFVCKQPILDPKSSFSTLIVFKVQLLLILTGIVLKVSQIQSFLSIKCPYDFGYGVADENNPINDYPDEDDFGDGVAADSSDDGEGSGDFDPFASDNEEYDTVAFDIEEQLRWSRRRWQPFSIVLINAEMLGH